MMSVLVSARVFPSTEVQTNTEERVSTTMRVVSTILMKAKVLMHSLGSQPSDMRFTWALLNPRSDTALKVATRAMAATTVP